jgi:hypothetical protein
MTAPKPEETRGVPWADHNPTETSPPDHRREEYGDEDSSKNADERATEESDEEKSDEEEGSQP